MAEFAHIVVERKEDVLRVRINRPAKRNALSRAVLAEIAAAFSSHAEEASLKVAVLTGAGDKAFAAGGDLQEFAAIRTDREARELFRSAREALQHIREFPVPVVAALNGVAVGGGAELALACDFRVAASSASIGFVQARLNISTGFGGGADLMRLLGPSRGLLCALRAEVLGAHDARAAGLIDEVAAAGESLDDCLERFLGPLRKPAPQVIRSYKLMSLAERKRFDPDTAFESEMAGFAQTWVHPDHWAAAEKILNKKA